MTALLLFALVATADAKTKTSPPPDEVRVEFKRWSWKYATEQDVGEEKLAAAAKAAGFDGVTGVTVHSVCSYLYCIVAAQGTGYHSSAPRGATAAPTAEDDLSAKLTTLKARAQRRWTARSDRATRPDSRPPTPTVPPFPAFRRSGWGDSAGGDSVGAAPTAG